MQKDIPGYEGLYTIDVYGNVYSTKTTNSRRKGKIKSFDNGTGYERVNLYDKNGNAKKHYVHRLVALVFIPNPDELKEVNHKDCDKKNNYAGNLEWCDRIQNLKHSYNNGRKRCGEKHGGHKLNESIVRSIRNSELSQNELAKKYGVSQSTIWAILHYRLWKEVI